VGADAGQCVQPLDVVKSKADTVLGQISPMGLTFCAREWQLLNMYWSTSRMMNFINDHNDLTDLMQDD